jgi:hypothetical protein
MYAVGINLLDGFGNAADVPDDIYPIMTLQWTVDDVEEQETAGCQVIQLQRLMGGGRECAFVPIPQSMITLLPSDPLPRRLTIKTYDAKHIYIHCELSCIVISGNKSLYRNSNPCYFDLTES